MAPGATLDWFKATKMITVKKIIYDLLIIYLKFEEKKDLFIK